MSAGPNTARRPVAASVSPSTSVWCTVPMSFTHVTPPASSSLAPRRTDAASEASVCAASSGQMDSRSQRNRSLCSASPRNSVWHRCRCACTNPGSTSVPRASNVWSERPALSFWSAAGTALPMAAIRPSITSRSPGTTVRAASMHTKVPPWIRNELSGPPPCERMDCDPGERSLAPHRHRGHGSADIHARENIAGKGGTGESHASSAPRRKPAGHRLHLRAP